MIIAIIDHERGIPSKCESSARVDYVPALCTHRPSLLSIERFSEGLGLVSVWRASAGTVGREDARTRSLGESKSRNKVSVGEPAEGSLSFESLLLGVRVPTVPSIAFFLMGERVRSRAHEAPCPFSWSLPFFGVPLARERPTVTARSFLSRESAPLCSSGLLWEGVRRVVRFKEWLSCCPVRSGHS